jgi:hypothetical protein
MHPAPDRGMRCAALALNPRFTVYEDQRVWHGKLNRWYKLVCKTKRSGRTYYLIQWRVPGDCTRFRTINILTAVYETLGIELRKRTGKALVSKELKAKLIKAGITARLYDKRRKLGFSEEDAMKSLYDFALPLDHDEAAPLRKKMSSIVLVGYQPSAMLSLLGNKQSSQGSRQGSSQHRL